MAKPQRIAAIDWMRGFVMILMLLDHVSMVYNANHIGSDSVATYIAGSPLPGFEFFSRWITHICAPAFVFLAGTALAISVERKVAKGIVAWQIDKDILIRGTFIAALDPTLISIFSGKLTIQVLYAIGVAMMCMAFLRRLSSTFLITIALAWIFGGELLTTLTWPPQSGSGSIILALLYTRYSSPNLVILYPLLPWLAVMLLGWVFGRFVLAAGQKKSRISPASLLLVLGLTAILGFGAVRYFNGYGNMELYREGNSWQQWLHVSKYPISLSFTLLELGLMAIILSFMMYLEPLVGTRPNGPLLVFGQTSMIYYLVHRLFLTGTGTYLGVRNITDLKMSYVITALLLILLYPFCLWYRGFKKRNFQKFSILKFL